MGLLVVGTLVGAYVAACVAGRLGYRAILYPAPQVDLVPAPPGARILDLRADDGVPVHAMELANLAATRTVVYFHGNGEVIGMDVWMAQRLLAQGFAVTLVEYRGYGRSRGVAPSEEGLYADATAVLDDLAARGVGADRVVLWGASLGTGVAVEMARRGRGSALVLVAPFTSITDMAARFAPIFPVRWVVPDHFDSLAKAPELRIPTTVVHGTDDEVVPFAMGERIAKAVPGSRFVPVEGAHHMDCFLVPARVLERVTAGLGH